MNKQLIRDKYKEKRFGLTQQQIELKSIQIANQSLKLSVWDLSYYHLFLPIEKQSEINTEFILQILFGRDKKVVVSSSDFKTFEMSHFLVDQDTCFKKNQFGIPEPQNGCRVNEKDLDVVFIPLLAFDQLGYRVGYGKGFYDRFLSKCKKSVVKIGLSFFDPIFEKIKTNPYDIKLDYCLTPNQIFQF